MVFTKIFKLIRNHFFNKIFYSIFPSFCSICGVFLEDFQQEICTACRHQLDVAKPRDFLASNTSSLFFTNKQVVGIHVLFRFEKFGVIQKLIHNFKYYENKKLSLLLGKWHAQQLLQCKILDDVDFLVIVPMHPRKKKQRGYNQVETYAEVLSVETGIFYQKNFFKKIKTSKTQSRQSKKDRFENVKNTLQLNYSEPLQGKHIVILDDVITTGATLLSCLDLLKTIPDIKVTLVSIAMVYDDFL